MSAVLPKTSAAMAALLRADFTTQWRNRRSVVLVLLVPVIILMSWKGLVSKLGPAFVLSTGITIGLTAIGLMGYSNALARDRDKGIFQRLRVAPIPTSYIMMSRLAVQMAMIILLTTLVFIVGYQRLHIELPAQSYVLGFLTAFAGGALYLGLGQMIAGLVKNSETVNSTTRLVYFVFIMVGMFGDLGMLGEQIKKIVHWSPWGTVKTIVSAGLQPGGWSNEATVALLVTAAYAFVFSFLGIKWFRWNVK
ncbi:ABC transporter permease [Flavisolibacter ginsenosidimutans]|uniref:ABC transporter permease n=1 Tax=Flavisolibacter ginsenosidimutans TaxID=661481 RepID=A0A5B8UK36_9BACT|nr:ABC transporter permease [Flavisolibacter ginsenosidimutans]QEC56762.1 ABC transporter permease [Flavisolibacter ginsenosidimutans]